MLNNKKTRLSEVLDLDSLRIDKFNIIKAPTSSGKTYAAVHHISKLCGEKHMLYLIDTTAGKENILNTYKEVEDYDKSTIATVLKDHADELKKVATIMTYAKFGYLLKCEFIDLSDYSVIVCDELQSLMDYMDWAEAPLKKFFPFATSEDRTDFSARASLPHIAFNTLIKILDDTESQTYLIALSATPRAILERVNDYLMVSLRGTLSELKETTTKYYPTINDIPYLISKTGKTLIYIPRISSMEKVRDKITELGIKCECIWSIRSKEKMSDFQGNLRKYVLEKERLPKSINVLIINAAYQTSINIKDEQINTVIVHSTEEDEIIQARGRVRHDIDKLYIFDPKANIVRPIPDQYLDHELTNEEKNELCKYFDIKDDKGQRRKFPYIISHLDDKEYSVISKRSKYTIKKQ